MTIFFSSSTWVTHSSLCIKKAVYSRQTAINIYNYTGNGLKWLSFISSISFVPQLGFFVIDNVTWQISSKGLVPNPHCIFITSSHKIVMGRVRDWWGSRHVARIWPDRSLVNSYQGRWVGRKRWLSLWSTGRKDHASSGTTKFKLQMAYSITDATSTGDNGGIWRSNSIFWDGLINCALRLVKNNSSRRIY